MQHTWKRFSPLLLASLFIVGASVAQAEIRTGQWETTITSEVEGMPFSPPPMTISDCVTEDDLVPGVEPQDQNCDVLEREIDGNRVNWRIDCTQEGINTRGSGELIYQGDTYQGEMTVHMTGGPMGELTMKQTLEGRRLGECQ